MTLLDEARAKTTNAEEALAGAENNAMYASSTAQSAKKQYAQQASSVRIKIYIIRNHKNICLTSSNSFALYFLYNRKPMQQDKKLKKQK